MSQIMKKGWDSWDTEILEGSAITRVGFPYMVRVNVGGAYQEVWRYYKLETVWGNTEPKTTDFALMIEEGEFIAYGNRAEYIEVELDGAYAQNPIGFLFGEEGLPTNNEVKESVDEKNETIQEPEAMEEILEDEARMEKIESDFEQDAIENAVAGADEVTFEDDKITVKKGNKVANIGDAELIKEIQDQIKKESQAEEKSDVTVEEDAMTQEEEEEVGLSAALEEEAERRGQPLSKGLKDLLKSNEPTYSVITNWWNALERPDRIKVRKALGVQTLDGVIDEFTSESNTFTEEDFIEDIKDCHL